MSANGYNSYRGRGSAVKVAVIAVSALVILGALAYLVVQNYVVYDDNGTAHLELPFLKDPDAPTPPVTGEDVYIDVVTPTDSTPSSMLSALHAQLLAADSLVREPEEVLSAVSESMVLDVKTDNGSISYTTTVDVPAEIYVEQKDTLAHLQSLLASDHYAVARMSVFCDSYFVRAYHDAALQLSSGGLWYDADGAAWLDPTNPQTLRYITSLCQEYAELGFEEILLDNFCYPTRGRVSSISGTEGVDRAQALTDFAESLRANLPEGVILSVAVRGELGAESGLSIELLSQEFDRIYVPSADLDGLAAQLPETFDSTRLVSMTYRAPAEGSYLLLG